MEKRIYLHTVLDKSYGSDFAAATGHAGMRLRTDDGTTAETHGCDPVAAFLGPCGRDQLAASALRSAPRGHPFGSGDARYPPVVDPGPQRRDRLFAQYRHRRLRPTLRRGLSTRRIRLRHLCVARIAGGSVAHRIEAASSGWRIRRRVGGATQAIAAWPAARDDQRTRGAAASGFRSRGCRRRASFLGKSGAVF